MGLPFCVTTEFPNLTTSTSRNLLPSLVKDIHILLLSYLPLLKKVLFFRNHRNHDSLHQPEDDRPSPSLVPVPFHLIDESIKKQLPITEYGDFLKRRGGCNAEDSVCVVCLNYMKESDGVRELCNCSHVFHKECLDVWIGQGQVTCPLCRSKLSPSQREEPGLGGDPWRMERLNYLFGEDYDDHMFTC
ncbi:E3 ubiquitin-protein ligase RHA1B-like [Fagus crenata]